MSDKKDVPASAPLRGRWFLVSVLALAVLAMAAVTLMVRARAAYSRGAAALSRGAREDAAVEFERALGFYLPADPVFRRSIEGMRAVAAGQEAAGDIEGALRTCGRLQAAIRETASILTGHGGLLRELAADQERLESRLIAAGKPVRGPSGPATVSADPLISALVILFFGIWVACTVVAATRLGGANPVLRWAAASLAAWAAWAVCLWRA